MVEWIKTKLASIPEREEFVSQDALSYWLRIERQESLDRGEILSHMRSWVKASSKDMLA